MASKLLLNALKAKIVSNPFAATPTAGQQDDSPTGQAMGDFHLTPATGTTPAGGSGASGAPPVSDPVALAPSVTPTVPVLDAAVSPSALAPAEALDLKALAPTGTGIAPVAEAPSAPPAMAVPEGGISLQSVTAGAAPSPAPVLAPVAPADAVVFPQLTLETDHEAEDLAAKVKVLEGQKRKLTFKRYLPRVAGFAVLAMASLSGLAFTGGGMPAGSIQTNLTGQEQPTPAVAGGNESITAMRYFIELSRVCPMDAPLRSKMQQQLREETNGLTVNEAIAYWVFACDHDLEAYVDRGFGPWAVERGVVSQESEVLQPLTRSVMQKVFAINVP